MRNYTLTFSFLLLLCINSSTLKAQYVFNEVDTKPGSATIGLIGDDAPGACINNKFIFIVDDSAHGQEMWVSDGTVAGTHMIKDIYPGTTGGIGGLTPTACNGKVYFAASDGINGMELWATDGTAAGTTMVADINIGAGSSNPTGGIAYNGKIYFSANNGATGKELWVSDGTAAGTQLLKDINPGVADGFLYSAGASILFNGKMYFQGITTSEGGELWLKDGTTSGTTMLKDLNPGAGGGYDGYPVIVGSKLFFISYYKLAVTDGTPTGTQIVSGQPSFTHIDKEMAAYNGKVYYVTRGAITPDDIELWSTDGTTSPQMLKDIWPGMGNSLPENMIVYNSKLYFAANDSVHGKELWVSDGTTTGTQMVKDINPGLPGSSIDRMSAFAGKLIFKYNVAGVQDLYVTDGTSTGTMVIQPANRTFTGYIFRSFAGVAVCNNIAYVQARYNDDGKELWIINDTSYHPSTGSVNKIANGKTFAIAPNPAADNVTINIADNNNNATLTISNLIGQKVYEQAIQGNNTQAITINLSNLSRGSYIVNLRGNNTSETQKLILE
jgi:ELWxxDGT repeat protein